MVRTGARAEILRGLLVEGGLRPTKDQPSLARIEALPPSIASKVLGLYRALGGQAKSPRFRPGQWDLAFEGDLVVELDEELHFNRYRALTLSQDWGRTCRGELTMSEIAAIGRAIASPLVAGASDGPTLRVRNCSVLLTLQASSPEEERHVGNSERSTTRSKIELAALVALVEERSVPT